MDKKFCLQYLKREHLQGMPEMEEIASAEGGSVSGIDVVKQLYLNHETARFYVPRLQSNYKLMKEVILNNSSLTIQQLRDKTGLHRDEIKRILADKK